MVQIRLNSTNSLMIVKCLARSHIFVHFRLSNCRYTLSTGLLQSCSLQFIQGRQAAMRGKKSFRLDSRRSSFVIPTNQLLHLVVVKWNTIENSDDRKTDRMFDGIENRARSLRFLLCESSESPEEWIVYKKLQCLQCQLVSLHKYFSLFTFLYRVAHICVCWRRYDVVKVNVKPSKFSCLRFCLLFLGLFTLDRLSRELSVIREPSFID